MTDDELFRRILIGGFITLVPVGAYHRFKAATSEKLDRKQEGIFLLVSIRLFGILGALGLLAFLIEPTWMAWSSMARSSLPLPVWLRWLGVCVGLLGGLLVIWTFRNLGKNLTDTVVTRKDHALVITGPYRWVRHPFYVSVALVFLANSLVPANWYVFATGAVVFLLLVIRTSKEEQKLFERFGDDYRQYMATTGRFWPRLHRT